MIAILGTGIMGLPMARNLLAGGFEVRAWNRTRSRAEPLVQDGGKVADSPAEAVHGAELVITMLAEGDAVASTMEDGGALRAMADDALWLQMSTVGIAANEALQALAEERGVPFVDAPVLGTKLPAEKGELIVLASGPEDSRERCQRVFDAVGSRTRWLGEAGAGTRMKLVLNNWLLSLVEGLAETIVLAESLAVDPREFLETIEGGPIGLPYAALKGPMMIERDFPPSFPLELALKDARLVLEAAERKQLTLPVAHAVESQMARAVADGHGDEDMAATYLASAARSSSGA
jgi:3-hydroxyisobutyrate dehydrogenase